MNNEFSWYCPFNLLTLRLALVHILNLDEESKAGQIAFSEMHHLLAYYLSRSLRVGRGCYSWAYLKNVIFCTRQHLFTASSLGIDEFEAFRRATTARMLTGPGWLLLH